MEYKIKKPLQTSLDEIAKHKPCVDFWVSLLKLRGHDPCPISLFRGDSTLFNVSEIGKLGSVHRLLWAARLFKGDDLSIFRWFSWWRAESIRGNIKNSVVRMWLDYCKKFLLGEVSMCCLEDINDTINTYYRMNLENTSYSTEQDFIEYYSEIRAAHCVFSIIYPDKMDFAYTSLNVPEELKKLMVALDEGVFTYDQSN